MFASEALAKFRESFSGRVPYALKQLLETKHLYQSVIVDHKDIEDTFAKQIDDKRILDSFRFEAHKLTVLPWHPVDPSPSFEKLFAREDPTSFVSFAVPHAKVFCTTCGRIEPFNCLSAFDVLTRGSGTQKLFYSRQGLVQAFTLSFICQSCKTIPEIFLVRRVGHKITLSGRAPIEKVHAPKDIPIQVRDYYSDAIVAYQSGQTLAGLFMCRTLIEQWTRAAGATQVLADQALDWYMSTLPGDFKSRFPSLRELYADISDALHAANASSELFVRSISAINEHFEARRLFKFSTTSSDTAAGNISTSE